MSRKIKRRLEICRKCRNFCEGNNGRQCLASYDGLIGMMVTLDNFVSYTFGVPKDFLFNETEDIETDKIKKDCFEKKTIPDNCDMKDVYLVSKWSNEKKD